MDILTRNEILLRNPDINPEIITGVGLGPSTLFYDATFRQKRKKGKFKEIPAPTIDFGPLADTHAHLDCITSAPLSLARCAVYNIGFICTITDITENPEKTFENLELWQEQAKAILKDWGLEHLENKLPEVRIAIGCHPHNARLFSEEKKESMRRYLEDPRVCAVGEVGLDYYYNKSAPEDQREVFAYQIRMAKEANLPLILHMRDAHDEGFEILQEEGFPEQGVLLHCFNLDKHVLKPWVEQDCYIAYGGPLTFKNCDYVREGALEVPRSRLLTETDSPFMTPEPLRGIECGPEHVIFTVECMLELFGCDSDEEKREFLSTLYDNSQGLLNKDRTL
ncbi:MAG: TatD family hydrolase [Anaerotardibacter sp.]